MSWPRPRSTAEATSSRRQGIKQSNIFPNERVQEMLLFMERKPDERLTRDVARETCERVGLKAMLVGSIAPIRSHYVIAIDAVNAHTSDVLAREQVEAESEEQVLFKRRKSMRS